MEYELLFSWQASSFREGTVLLPAGSLEQHGTEAPLGCDCIIARRLCADAGEATGTPVLPAVPYGDSECHEGFPGTFSLEQGTLVSVYSHILRSAARNGFRRCLIISGHGGNRSAALKACSDGHGLLSASYHGWWQLPGADEEERRLFPRSGWHVTAAEVSMVWHLLGKPPPARFTGTYPPWNDEFKDPALFRKAYPDGGVGGDMSLVSVENGALLYRFLVGALCELIGEGP